MSLRDLVTWLVWEPLAQGHMGQRQWGPRPLTQHMLSLTSEGPWLSLRIKVMKTDQQGEKHPPQILYNF